jgi:hypothetical protein
LERQRRDEYGRSSTVNIGAAESVDVSGYDINAEIEKALSGGKANE